MTATNQQVISLEKRLSEVAAFNQQMVDVQERLDKMDSHVKDVATAEVGRRAHLLRRGLEQEVATFNHQMVDVQERLDNMNSHVKNVATAEVERRTHLFRRGLELEKAAAKSRSDKIFNLGQDFEELMKNTSNLSARVDILDNNHDILKSEMKLTSEKTGAQMANVQQEVATTQRNTQTLQSRVDTIERTQSDLQSKASSIAKQVDTTRGQIATVQQEVVTTQRNTQTLKSRVDTMEKTQLDLQSNASSIATQVDTTRGQIATVQQESVTIQRNTQTLQSRIDTIERTQSDLQLKTRAIDTQVDTTRRQISRLQTVTGTFVGFSTQLQTLQPYYNKSTVIKFNAIIYNDGGHYNTSTGIFTVPVSGVYVFMFYVRVYYDSSDKGRLARVNLYVNGEFKASAFAPGVGDLTGGNAAVVKVSTGDRVYVSTYYHERHYIGPYETTFSGALLHVI